jgi:hypothetical protein
MNVSSSRKRCVTFSVDQTHFKLTCSLLLCDPTWCLWFEWIVYCCEVLTISAPFSDISTRQGTVYCVRNIFWLVKKLAELANVPILCRRGRQGMTGEADDETLYYRTSDSLLNLRLNISPAKNFH